MGLHHFSNDSFLDVMVTRGREVVAVLSAWSVGEVKATVPDCRSLSLKFAAFPLKTAFITKMTPVFGYLLNG